MEQTRSYGHDLVSVFSKLEKTGETFEFLYDPDGFDGRRFSPASYRYDPVPENQLVRLEDIRRERAKIEKRLALDKEAKAWQEAEPQRAQLQRPVDELLRRGRAKGQELKRWRRRSRKRAYALPPDPGSEPWSRANVFTIPFNPQDYQPLLRITYDRSH